MAALRDPDANVRLMSGNAIAAIGPGAAPAVSALVAIGPAAAPALPVLREIAKQPRVRWAAEAAIRDIEGDAP